MTYFAQELKRRCDRIRENEVAVELIIPDNQASYNLVKYGSNGRRVALYGVGFELGNRLAKTLNEKHTLKIDDQQLELNRFVVEEV